jgi:hypothetical protein
MRKLKLPSIELKKFRGDIKDWLTFCGQFKKIDGDPDIDEADKFQYLLQGNSPDIRAREMVESFPPIASNYNKTVECFESPFLSGTSASRVICEKVAQVDNDHELQGRQGHPSIRVRQDREPTESAGDIRGGHRKVCGHVVPTSRVMPVGGSFKSVATWQLCQLLPPKWRDQAGELDGLLEE